MAISGYKGELLGRLTRLLPQIIALCYAPLRALSVFGFVSRGV
jgi:hypothetical protein